MPVDHRHAVYAGSFDPITSGHAALIDRALALYDTVTIAIGVNVHKKPLFSLEERVGLIEQSLPGRSNLRVTSFEGLLVEYARSIGAGVILRGLRMLTDFEAEFQLALANRDLAPEVETVFLMTHKDHVYVSSSLVKEIAVNRGDFSRYVTKPVRAALLDRFPPRDAGGDTGS